MKCLDCGAYVPKIALKPCKEIYKSKFPNGVPICDKCCKICRDTPGIDGKKGCKHFEK